MKWKYKSAGILLASVGAGKREKPKQVKMKLSDDFMQAMKEAESDRNTDSTLAIPLSNYTKIPSINLASDWGAKFDFPPKDPARRVVIEADGYHHYASNCDHTLGGTVLKRRQTGALGWQVVSVS